MGQNVAAIICAAGASSRFGGKRKKAFVDVAGRAVFLRSVEIFANREDVKSSTSLKARTLVSVGISSLVL